MDNKQKVISNLIWRFMERFGSQLVAMVVQIILARMLDPAVFGTVAKVTIIATILLVFVDSGMANSLIQKKTRTISTSHRCSISIWRSALCCMRGSSPPRRR